MHSLWSIVLNEVNLIGRQRGNQVFAFWIAPNNVFNSKPIELNVYNLISLNLKTVAVEIAEQLMTIVVAVPLQ